MGDRRQRVERVVEIYESADAVMDPKANRTTENVDTERKRQIQQPGGDTAVKRGFRLTAVCLVLLSVLLLAVVIVLGVKFNIQTAANNQLQTKYQNLTMNRNQLQSKYQNLTVEINQLQKEREELTKWFSNLNPGWKYFNSSIYYISTDIKTWAESDKDCRNRNTSLVIVNSNEEEVFINKELGSGEAWIGLSDQVTEKDWKWVDGTPLTTNYWREKEPNNEGEEDCAEVFGAPEQGWNDRSCAKRNRWICEKRVF